MDMSYDDVLSLLLSGNLNDTISLLESNNLDKDTYSIIYKNFPKVIRRNYQYNSEDSENEDDEKEVDEEEYERLVDFFKALVTLKKMNLLKVGLETAYDINENINMILYDLASTFFKNEMLKEYFQIVTEFNNNKYFVDEALTEAIGDMFVDIDPDKIYYLITEIAVFAIANRHYELMKFIIDAWNSRDNESNFETKVMSKEDMEKTLETIKLLEDILNKK